ncbi:Hpt domain-containing protein [Sulfurimonas sp. HSL-1716]|uniref:Hpt domain-containing protein n=1 Tax=Hydrocurvibacter sulfurireducens TaxID=3131937 RepID=UPI0031F86369
MLIYNHKQEFIGIDEKDLKILGFKNLAELQTECSDFADLFVKKPNYIHNFKNFNWIYYILHSDIHEAKVIINAKQKNFTATIELQTLYLSDAPDQPAYAITLLNLRALDGGESEVFEEDLKEVPIPIATPSEESIDEELPDLENEESVELSEPDVFETPVQTQIIEDPYDFDFNAPLDIDDIYMSEEEPQEEAALETTSLEEEFEHKETGDVDFLAETAEAEEIEEKEVKKPLNKPMLGDYTAAADSKYLDNLKVSQDYTYDPHVASDELGLPVDLINEFIGDFIQQSHDFKDELYTHIASSDFDGVKLLSHKLKGVAANLRIEDAFEVLSIINASDNINEIKANLDHFYKIIAKLEGKETAETAPVETAATTTPLEEEPLFDQSSEENITEDIGLKNEALAEKEELEEFIELPGESEEENIKEHIGLKEDDGIEHPQELNETEETDDDIYKVGIKYHEDEPITLEPYDFNIQEDLDKYDFDDDDLLEHKDESEPFILDGDDHLMHDDDLAMPQMYDLSEKEDDQTNDVLNEAPEEESQKEPSTLTEDTMHYDKKETANELGLDEEFVDQLLSDFKEQANDLIDGMEAAIRDNDFTALKNFAINIKGTSDNLRLNKISHLLEELTFVEDTQKAEQLLSSFKNYVNQI